MAGGSLSETPDSSTVHSSTRHDTIFINHVSFLSVARVRSGPRLLTFLHEYSDSIQILSQSSDKIFWRLNYLSLINLGLRFISLGNIIPQLITVHLLEVQI